MPDDLWGLSSTEIPTDLSSPDQGDLWGVQTGIAQPQQEVQQPTGVDRSKLMDVPTALVAGVTDLAEQFARARLVYGGHAGGENLDEEHTGGTEDYIGQFANWLVINKEKFEKEHPYIYAPAKDEGELRRSIREGLRSTIPSLGAGIPGAVIGTTIGTAAGVPVAGAVAGFASSGGTIFGLAQYDQVVRDVLKHNAEHPESAIPEEVYKNEGFKQALIEGGFEAVSNAIEAGFFGLGKLATQPVKESVRSILKQGWKGSAKNYLLAQAKAQPAEVLTEMAQNYLETQSNIDMGLPQEQTPWQAATNAIGPTVFSTMLIGAGFHGIDVKKRANITKALENPETDFDTRFDAMRTIYSELQKSDKVNGTNLAQKWGEIAQYKLLEGEAIELDKKFTDMKPLEGLLADKETAIQNDIDTNKFLERGKTPVETEEVIPEGEKKPDDDKTVRRTMGIELRQQLFDKFIEKGFSEEKANEMASFVMGAKDPSILTPNTQPSVILDKDGKPIEKEVPQDSTSGTIKLTYGKSIIQNIPENIKNQFVFTSKGELFSNKGAVKAILKKQGLSETYAPMMLAQNEWVGVPISMPQLTQDLYQIASGNRQQPLIKSTQQQEQVQGTTQTPVTPTVQPTTYENIQSDDLTNKGKPFTNKVSAKLAIQKNYKEMKYTGTEEKYVPVQIGEKQWVARRKESVPVQPKVESAQEYVNRRNAEYLAAKTPTEGLAKLNEIIIGLEELGHEKTKVYQRTVSRRNAVAKTIEREQRKEEKKNVKQEPIAKETIEEVSTVTQEEPTEVKPETQENVTSKEGGETNGQVQTETQVTPTKKVEKLRANAVEKRLKAGEDVTDEDVAKFKTLALRWTRNAETNKWEEHEPAYKVEQNRPTLTEEEREARADQRAIAKAEKNPKKIVKKTPRELIKKSQSELKKLKAELAKATTEQEREDLEYAIDSTRQDIKILANRLMAKKSSPKVQWFGEEDNGEETTKKEHPLAKHISYMSPVMAQEQIDHYTEVESDTGMRMLKKMSPVTMPRAFAAMINYAGHFSDGTVDLNMISKFIQQLEEGVKAGKLDNFFAPIESSEAGTYDEKESFKQDVATVKDLLQKTIDLGIVPKQSGNFQRVESNKGPGLSVKEVTDVADQILDLWPNSPFVIVLDNRDQLPPELKAKIAGDAGKYTIGGAQLGDTVFLIRNELHNKFDVERTLLHESIGHYGIYQTLGTKFDSTALSVFDSFKDTDRMKKIVKDYSIDINNEQDKIDAGAEYLGFMAEENLGAPTFWEKIKTAVNNILRDFGFDIKLTNADIKFLLADSQKFLEGKTGISQSIEDYFSDEKIPRFDKVTKAPTFYSALLQTVTTRTDMPTKPQSLLNWLNKFVKPAEMKWMGVEQYLKGKDKIDKKDFENFLKSNQIEVKEVTHADIPSDSPNKVKQLFENGAMEVTRDAEGNYHGWYYTVDKDLDSAEWFVSIHRDGRPYTTTYGFETEDEALDQGLELVDEAVIESNETNITEDQLEPGDSGQTTPTRYGQWVLPGGKNYKELLLIWNPGKSNDLQETLDAGGKPSDIYETAYQSNHWNEPNVIGHIRLDERTDDKGRSVLFIEEIQSDWLQAAKERGFSNNEEKDNLIKKIDQLTLEWEKARTAFDDYTDNRAYTVREARLDPEYQRLREEVNGIFMEREVANRELERLVDKPNIPRAPFLENWHEVLMKRMIRYAVDNNFDVVAWTTGKQQADRYNLAKVVDELTVEKDSSGTYTIFGSKNRNSVVTKTNLSEDDLVSNMGQDLTTKAVDSLSRGNKRKTFVGLDLEIGGKGMKVFYDEKLKNFTEKYIKQWGARLETASIPNKVNDKTYTDKWTSITDPDWSIEKGNDGKYFIYTSDTIIPKFGPAQTWNEAMELVRDNVSSHVLFNEEQNPDPNTDNLKQPGFTITAEMAKSVVEKGQPWFRKTDSLDEDGAKPENNLHSIKDLETIASGKGKINLYHGAPKKFAEQLVSSVGSKTPGKWKSAEDMVKYISDLYKIPLVELNKKAYLSNTSNSYGTDVSRVSTAPAKVAERWAGSFPYGEVLSNMNTSARLYAESKRLGMSYDDFYDKAFEEADKIGKEKGIQVTVENVADVLGLPDKMSDIRKGGALTKLTVDVRSLNNSYILRAQRLLKAIADGKISEEEALESWNNNYSDIKVSPQNIKKAEIVKSGLEKYNLYSGIDPTQTVNVLKGLAKNTGNKAKKITAWHVTEAKPFSNFKDGLAIPSSEGMYFWPTRKQAESVAGPNSRIIEVEIDLGRTTRVKDEGKIGNFKRGTMSKDYDTATGTGMLGDEIVVFNPDNIKIKSPNGDVSKIDMSAGADIEPRGRLRIVDYADITPDAPKQELKNLFSDEAYAMLKTMVMQLPKNQPALHWAERYLMSPEWYKHPTMQKIVRAAIDRHDRYFELFNLLNEMEVNPETMRQKTWENSSGIIEANVKLMHRGLSPTQILKGETSKEYKQLEKMKDQIDTGEWKEGYGENIPTWEQHFQNEGVGKDVIDLYKMHRAAYDKALDILMEPMQKLVETIDKQAEKDKSKPKYPEFITLDEDGKPVKINLKAVLARMGSLKGTYAPRLRETGDYVVKGNRFGKVVRYHKSNRFAAELLKRELEKKGYKVEEIFERERLPEDVYASLRIVNTQQAIKTAMQRMEGVDPELETKFNEELLKEVADLIRVRGFRASMVTRKQGETIRGYITDPNERFARYINNISAGIAKGEAAKEMFETLAGHYEGEGKDKKLIGGIDPSKEPRAYDTATKYIEEQLRNSDAADRLVGLIKSLASFKYLGFNLRSPVVNILSLATTVPTAIHQYGLNGKGSMVKIMGAISTASNDYRKVMLGKPLNNKYEQALIDEIKTRGYDTPQYTRDALGTIQRTHGKVWAKTMAISMYLFGKSEQWIRGTTMLAAYRLTKSANPNMDEHDLIRKAHDVSDKAHGIYGKSTQLAVGQGTGPAARLSQILYTFGKFPHNYLQMLYDTGVRKGNIKAFLYGLISPVILGGATVIPMKNLLFGIVGLMFKAAGSDDDPEKGFWDWIRKKLGKTTERVGRHGLLGAANLDVSGSMSIGVGTPRNFYELFGVAGGLYKDIEDAMHFLQIGQPGRAAEKTLPTGMGNIFRAIRELNGVTTTKGQRVWDDQGKPYVPSTTETAARLAGFRSAEQATMSERTWETKREIASYKVRHDKILEQWRDYVIDKGSNEDMQHIMDAISKYNNSIMKSGKAGEIPFITSQTLKTQAKALYKPSKAMSVGMFKE